MAETDESTPVSFPPLVTCRSEEGFESLHYSIFHEEMPDEFRRLAEKELNETEEKRMEGMHRLKKLIRSEDLEFLDDIYLLAVLRACKYNFKMSEVKLKKFVVDYKKIIIMAVNLDMIIIEKIIDDMCFGVVPYRDAHGRLVMYTRVYAVDLDTYSYDDMATCFLVTVLFLLTFPMTSVTGFVHLLDNEMKSAKLFLSSFRKFMHYVPLFFSFPVRLKRVDLFNEFRLLRWGFNILAAVMPDKIAKRAVFHGAGYGSLHNVYNPKILPQQFGGNLGSKTSLFYKEKLMNFIREMKVRHNRSTS